MITERVQLVVDREVGYWVELATREGCKVDQGRTDDGTIRVTISHPTLTCLDIPNVYIFVEPARGNRADTRTLILRPKRRKGHVTMQKLTRRTARIAIEGITSIKPNG